MDQLDVPTTTDHPTGRVAAPNPPPPRHQTCDETAEVLRTISQRVLWLSTAIVDAANRGRPNATGVKVGGHQASSASMVDIMVALWFHELASPDRVSVKPHASPVLHAINYLLGRLDGEPLLCRRGERLLGDQRDSQARVQVAHQ